MFCMTFCMSMLFTLLIIIYYLIVIMYSKKFLCALKSFLTFIKIL